MCSVVTHPWSSRVGPNPDEVRVLIVLCVEWAIGLSSDSTHSRRLLWNDSTYSSFLRWANTWHLRHVHQAMASRFWATRTLASLLTGRRYSGLAYARVFDATGTFQPGHFVCTPAGSSSASLKRLGDSFPRHIPVGPRLLGLQMSLGTPNCLVPWRSQPRT